MSISAAGPVRPARRLRPMPAARRTDTTLRDSELLFGELLEALPAAVYTIDRAGRITFFNKAAADLMAHRVKNLFAVTSGLGTMSARSARARRRKWPGSPE